MDDDDELLTITIVALTIYCVPCYSATAIYVSFFSYFFLLQTAMLLFLLIPLLNKVSQYVAWNEKS